MSNHQEISSFIWRVCDDELRGLFKPHEYGDIILPFVVLRRLDCLIEPHKDEVVKQYNELLQSGIDDPTPIIRKKTGLNFFNYSPYDLTRLKSDPNGLKINFPNYLNGYSDNVHQILENFQLDKPVEKLIKNNKLYSLIDKFTEVDLHPDKIDNHTMGSIFEELLRKFSEMSNETSGEHYTPRDIVKLLVSLVFSGDEDNLKGEGIIRSIFDPCCGTGGMITIGKEWVKENISTDVMFQLYGQELNPQTFSICKSDFLITGEDPERIKLGSSLSNDQHEDRTFDYMITNPPFGVSWKSEQSYINEESKNPLGRFSIGTPRSSDGSLLFLQHMISKMKPEGSRIGVVFNGSPLFTGDSGSGESEIRKWIIENDWLECIVSLPTNLFFNTSIPTYIWLVSNKKKKHRKGKVQLIDGSSFYTSLNRNLGSKNRKIDDEGYRKIIQFYQNFDENKYSKIFENQYFGHTKITIEQPLKENGEIVRKKDGTPKPDSKLRDYERVPLSEDIEEYYSREVEPHLPDSWIDYDKSKVGYEINFNKYFYKYTPLKSSTEIMRELEELEVQIQSNLNELK
ncbi:type I restriction-modification system subunit M [Polaribacter sp.]|uniref:type I restriction-modification system subunit M n=1 Tax=Polaribacter sp. TaxID=1920175 RepID=UPI003F6A5137